MPPFWIVLAAFLLALPLRAQDLIAVTDGGDLVVLSDDSTWRYASGDEIAVYDSASAVAFGVGAAYSLDAPSGWTSGPAPDASGSELFLQFEHQPIYAVTFYEDIEYPLDVAREIVLGSARNTGSEPELLREEIGTLNGVDVATFEFRVKAPNVVLPMRFLTTVYSGPEGTVRLAIWTFDSLFERNRETLGALRGTLQILPPTLSDF